MLKLIFTVHNIMLFLLLLLSVLSTTPDFCGALQGVLERHGPALCHMFNNLQTRPAYQHDIASTQQYSEDPMREHFTEVFGDPFIGELALLLIRDILYK